MAASGAIASQGTLLKMGDGGGTEVFTTIGEVIDITGPDGKRKTIPVTPIDATRAQKLGGAVLDWGQVTFKCNYIPGSATHGIATGLKKKFKDNIKTNFKLIKTNDSAGSATAVFAAWVVGIKETYPNDGSAGIDVTIDITDDVTDGA